MDDLSFGKLKAGLRRALATGQDIPPITVRPHPDGKGYQIIDGYHRHKALVELGQDRINVFSMNTDEKMARIYTNTLNYLRGQPDRAKYAQGIADLVEVGAGLDELEELLPEGRDDLEQMLQEATVSMEALQRLHADGDDAAAELAKTTAAEDDWVELKFRVSVAQSEVIEMEIKRLGTVLTGKNIRGRALEYMAAQSAQTPVSA